MRHERGGYQMGEGRMRHLSILSAAALLLILLPFAGAPARATGIRIKDITDIPSLRENQLTGMGLVTGLGGTGDSTEATRQAVVNLLRKMNVNVSTSDVDAGNVALVLVSSTLPPNARTGSRIDVTVTSIGDAKSLRGGILVQTPLSGADGEVYAVADGPVTIGGFSASGAAASVQKNSATVGLVSAGAIIEKEVPCPILDPGDGSLLLTLRNPDFTTACRIVEAVNTRFEDIAVARDMTSIRIKVPRKYAEGNLVGFVAQIQAMTVEPDTIAKVVINPRTGTIVSGAEVKIGAVAITHGNLIITVAETPEVSQPPPFALVGKTVTVPRTDVSVEEPEANFVQIGKESTVADLAQALNAIGVTPRDLTGIFQLLKKAGVLHAELVIM